jgi:hypothetical protein
MKRWTSLTNWQAYRWLLRYDSEATWLWTKEFVMADKGTLKLAVRDNLRDYGV